MKTETEVRRELLKTQSRIKALANATTDGSRKLLATVHEKRAALLHELWEHNKYINTRNGAVVLFRYKRNVRCKMCPFCGIHHSFGNADGHYQLPCKKLDTVLDTNKKPVHRSAGCHVVTGSLDDCAQSLICDSLSSTKVLHAVHAELLSVKRKDKWTELLCDAVAKQIAARTDPRLWDDGVPVLYRTKRDGWTTVCPFCCYPHYHSLSPDGRFVCSHSRAADAVETPWGTAKRENGYLVVTLRNYKDVVSR